MQIHTVNSAIIYRNKGETPTRIITNISQYQIRLDYDIIYL